MTERVAIVETQIGYVREDMADIKEDLNKRNDKLDRDLAARDEKIDKRFDYIQASLTQLMEERAARRPFTELLKIVVPAIIGAAMTLAFSLVKGFRG